MFCVSWESFWLRSIYVFWTVFWNRIVYVLYFFPRNRDNFLRIVWNDIVGICEQFSILIF